MTFLQRPLSRRQALIAVSGLAAGLTLAEVLEACANNANPTNAVHTDSIAMGVSNIDAPVTGDPIILQNYASGYAPVFASTEQLHYRDVAGRLQPGLASDWKVASDNLTWTLTARSGVKMQDGSTFTAKDIETGVNRLLKNSKYQQVIYGNIARNIASVKVLDDSHIQIVTRKPYPTLILDFPPPVPTNYYNTVGDDKYSAQPLQAGPFKFISFQQNQSINFVRHDDYWDKRRAANYKNLTFKIIPDESTRVAGLISGDIDTVEGLSPEAVKQLQANNKVRAIPNLSVGMAQMYLQGLVTEPNSPIQDVRVRQALVYAVDRGALNKTLFNNTAPVAAVSIPPNSNGYDPKLKPLPFDVNKAKQLMAAAGVANGFNFQLNYSSPDSGFPQINSCVQAIAQYWQAIGVKTELNPMDSATLQATRRAGKMKGGYLAPGTALSWSELGSVAPNIYLSSSSVHIMQDPKIDEIVGRLSTTTNDADRAKIAVELTDYFYETLPILPFNYLPSFMAIGPKVRQLKPQAAIRFINPWFLQAN
jgi:peptide/nickel transport system substrate-binding protein